LHIVFADFSEDESVLWLLELPSDVVEDSARADVSVVGDLLGPTLLVRSTVPQACETFIVNFPYTLYRNFLDEV
jgi:hypothetical protein